MKVINVSYVLKTVPCVSWSIVANEHRNNTHLTLEEYYDFISEGVSEDDIKAIKDGASYYAVHVYDITPVGFYKFEGTDMFKIAEEIYENWKGSMDPDQAYIDYSPYKQYDTFVYMLNSASRLPKSWMMSKNDHNGVYMTVKEWIEDEKRRHSNWSKFNWAIPEDGDEDRDVYSFDYEDIILVRYSLDSLISGLIYSKAKGFIDA